MMPATEGLTSQLRRAVAHWVVGGACIFGFLDGCNDQLVQFTRFVDPCGTILATCAPGDFEIRQAEVGDFCVDPTCTIPGSCGFDDLSGTFQPIGTRTEICP